MNDFIDKHFKKVIFSLYLIFLIVNIYTIIDEIYLTEYFNYIQIFLISALLCNGLISKDISYNDKKFMTEIFVFANVIQLVIIFMLKTLN